MKAVTSGGGKQVRRRNQNGKHAVERGGLQSAAKGQDRRMRDTSPHSRSARPTAQRLCTGPAHPKQPDVHHLNPGLSCTANCKTRPSYTAKELQDPPDFARGTNEFLKSTIQKHFQCEATNPMLRCPACPTHAAVLCHWGHVGASGTCGLVLEAVATTALMRCSSSMYHHNKTKRRSTGRRLLQAK